MVIYNEKHKENNVLVVFTEEMKTYEPHIKANNLQSGIHTASLKNKKRFRTQEVFEIVMVVGSLTTERQRNTVSHIASCFSEKGSYVMGALIFEDDNTSVPDEIASYFSIAKSSLDCGIYFTEFLQSLSTFLMEVLKGIGNSEGGENEMQRELYTFRGLLNADWGTFEYNTEGRIPSSSFLNNRDASAGISSILVHLMVSEAFSGKNGFKDIIKVIDWQLKGIPYQYLQLNVDESISDPTYFYMWQAKTSIK